MKVTMQDVIKKTVFFSSLLALAVLSLAPGEALPDTGVSDKLEHFAAYGVLSLMGMYAYPDKSRLWWVITGLVLYGISLETLQILVPSRFFSIGDIIANTLGVLSGYGLIFLMGKLRRRVSG
jgi:VanZ family protein